MNDRNGIGKSVSVVRRTLAALTMIATASVAGAQQGTGAWPAEINPAAEMVYSDILRSPGQMMAAAGSDPEPVVIVTPSALEFEVYSQGSDSQVLDILNQGGTDLEWSFEAESAAGTQVWASVYGVGQFSEAYELRVSPDGSRVFIHGTASTTSFLGQFGTVAYDAATGAELWSVEQAGVGGLGFALGRGMDLSPDGQTLYVTGTTATDDNNYDYMVLAYDAADGGQLWIATYDGPASDVDIASAMRVSPDGSQVFVTGHSVGNDSQEYATIAYDALTGNEQWVSRYRGPVGGTNEPVDDDGLQVSPDGSKVFVAGTSMGDDTGLGYATVAYDAATGEELWVSRYDGPGNGNDSPYSMTLSADGTHLFVTGWSEGPGTGDDYATIAYDASNGGEFWVTRLDGPASDFDRAFSISADPLGDAVYVTGTITGPNGREIATLAYDQADGSQIWYARHSEPDNDFATGWAIGSHPDGSQIYVGGDISIHSKDLRYWVVMVHDAETGEIETIKLLSGVPEGHSGFAALEFSVDGSRLYATGVLSTDRTQMVTVAYETGACVHPDDIPWLIVEPDAGTTPSGDTSSVTVTVNADGLVHGTYSTITCISTTDPVTPLVQLPITFRVVNPHLFSDRFEMDKQ